MRKEYCSFGQLIPLPAQNYLFLWVATTEQNQARKALFSVPTRPIQGPPSAPFLLPGLQCNGEGGVETGEEGAEDG